MTWSYSVSNEPGMRSWAWTVLASGGTVSSSREATSHVGVLIVASAASLISGGPPGVWGSTTRQSGTDAANKNYVDANFVKFVPGAEQLSVGDANGTAPMINLRGGSTCCSGPGGHTPAWFKVFQNGSFVATGNLGIGVSPM